MCFSPVKCCRVLTPHFHIFHVHPKFDRTNDGNSVWPDEFIDVPLEIQRGGARTVLRAPEHVQTTGKAHKDISTLRNQIHHQMQSFTPQCDQRVDTGEIWPESIWQLPCWRGNQGLLWSGESMSTNVKPQATILVEYLRTSTLSACRRQQMEKQNSNFPEVPKKTWRQRLPCLKTFSVRICKVSRTSTHQCTFSQRTRMFVKVTERSVEAVLHDSLPRPCVRTFSRLCWSRQFFKPACAGVR